MSEIKVDNVRTEVDAAIGVGARQISLAAPTDPSVPPASEQNFSLRCLAIRSAHTSTAFEALVPQMEAICGVV